MLMKSFQAVLTSVALGLAALQVDAACRADAAAGNSTVSTITCANVRCVSGTQCELQKVDCEKAPCPMIPKCVPLHTCSPGLCDVSETCELDQVQCIKAPCLPVPKCVPQPVTRESCTKECSEIQRCFLYKNEPHCADICSQSRCGPKERCQLESVNCVMAPCPRVAVCRAA